MAPRIYSLEKPSVEYLLAKMDHMSRMLDAGFPLEESKVDYITDIDQRRDIFLLFKKFQDDNNIQPGLNAVGLAIILVAPIDQLQHLLNELNTDKYPLCAIRAASIFATMQIDAVLGIKAFIRAGSCCHGNPDRYWDRCDSFAAVIPSNYAPRRVLCPIRGTDDVSRARIIPQYFCEKEFRDCISTMLRVFWDQKTVGLWEKLSAYKWFHEPPHTRLHISNSLHRLLSEARVALKPLDKMKDGSIIVQLFWLKGTSLKPQEFLTKPHDSVSFEDVLKRAGLENNQEWGSSLAFRADGHKLLSGQLFVLKANKAVGIAAPRFELLQLLWDLTRVAAICGAINEADDLRNVDDVVDYMNSCEAEGNDNG
ncbi:hypothetical protein GGI42DRAFT_367658 [Trichoderma sp. SZMC 28013]